MRVKFVRVCVCACVRVRCGDQTGPGCPGVGLARQQKGYPGPYLGGFSGSERFGLQ